MKKENLVKNVSFRLTQTEFKPYEKILIDTGVNKSLLFREIFMAKSGEVILSNHLTKDNKRLLFIASKASNNINQIARRLNNDHRSGVVSEKVYIKMLNTLISVERSFSGAMDKC